MVLGIRELDEAELAAAAGGGAASDLGKIEWGLTGGLIAGPVGAAAGATFYVLASSLLDYLSSCSQCGEGLGQPM
jgi:hypothetical protein